MEKISISLNAKRDREEIIDVKTIVEAYGFLTITTKSPIKLIKGDIIGLRRVVSSEAYGDVVVRDYSVVVTEIISDYQFKIVAPEAKPLIIESVNSANCVSFTEQHSIFAQDLKIHSSYTMDVLNDIKGRLLYGFSMCDAFHSESGVTPTEFLYDSEAWYQYMCTSASGITRTVVPYYIPAKLDRYRIFVESGDTSLSGMSVMPSENEFYYHIDSGGTCNMYEGTNVYLEKNYMSIPLSFTENSDYVHLYQEDKINNGFVAAIKDSIIPEVIDFEKVKYSPNVAITGTPKMASSITFNLHFRKRKGDNWEYDGRGYNDTTSGKSDLMGYLHFTDSDIQYQKLKVKKSFIRLSFYTTNDPLTQKLLYYSTIFFDTNDLYGKFIRTKKEWKNDTATTVTEVVLYDGGTNRVDSQIVVRNEYNYDKSSEGFYLYLFASDAPTENEEKTIYMKVEFNHAGVGKTIPMIPAESGVTIENYFGNLYIPVKIGYIDDRYIYGFNMDKGFYFDEEDNNIRLDLFEPIL